MRIKVIITKDKIKTLLIYNIKTILTTMAINMMKRETWDITAPTIQATTTIIQDTIIMIIVTTIMITTLIIRIMLMDLRLA